MTQPKTTLYENLAIQPGASRSEIDVAYRKALKGLEVEELAHYSVDAHGAIDIKRQLLEKTYAVLSRPDLKSRYDSGEAVPFAAALPESQRSLPTKRLADREALKSALKEKPSTRGFKKRGDSQQLKAFRDNFNPDRLRPIAEVESELLAGKSNIVGTRHEDESVVSAALDSRSQSSSIDAASDGVNAHEPGIKDAGMATPEPGPLRAQALESASTTQTTPIQSRVVKDAIPPARKQRGLEPEVLRRVSEHAATLNVFSGANLADLRELAGLTREDMERVTKVNQRHLRSIEADDYASLPVRVYVRGFIQEYARALGLDRDRVSGEFLRLYDGHRGTP